MREGLSVEGAHSPMRTRMERVRGMMLKARAAFQLPSIRAESGYRWQDSTTKVPPEERTRDQCRKYQLRRLHSVFDFVFVGNEQIERR